MLCISPPICGLVIALHSFILHKLQSYFLIFSAVSGANCYLSNTSSLNDTQYNMLTDIPCMKLCPSTLEQCGDGAKRAIVYTYDTVGKFHNLLLSSI